MKAPRHTLRRLLPVAALAFLAFATPARAILVGTALQTNAKPNIIVILVDDLGYGDLSSYGAPDMKTPNVDRLSVGGMRFDRFYANCPVCSPTRASLLTGRFPDLVGVPGVIRTHRNNSWGRLAADAVLLPQMLKKAGYHTAIIGKWHLGLKAPDTPLDRGFDHFHGFLGDMMDDYYNHRRHRINYMTRDRETIDPEGHATDLFSDWAVAHVRERAKRQKPFFLYLAYNAPHTPIQPPKEWVERVKAREKGISDKRAKIVALIEHMDAGIGRVINAVAQSGIGHNTLLVFTSDNGGQSNVGARNAPWNGAKGQMLEGGLAVPTYVVWPKHIKPGTRSDRVALTMDIFPTVCDAAGVDVAHTIDGVSFLPTLQGKPQPEPDRLLVWMRREGGKRYAGDIFYAVRRGDWKLLQNAPDEPFRLYNLREDPHEDKPLPESHPKFKELSAALKKHRAVADRVPWQPAE